RLLVVAGSTAYRGAAALALAGASGSGVGSLRAALPQEVAEGLWRSLPHVVVQAALGATGAGGLALGELPGEALDRLDAVVLGPGLGRPAAAGESALAEAALWQALAGFEGLLVLDADGLNRLADPAWLARRAGPTWLTPHRGEFDRLFPSLAGEPPLEAARRAAQQAGCTVLLKGARSVVAAADGRLWQLRRAWPAAARAGLGDVLAGFAGGIGARAVAAGGLGVDLPPLLAGAALAHAEAGGLVVRQGGEGAAAPAAVAKALPAVMKVKKSPHLQADNVR
ncbi:MAG: NAD(P)H-hydrate dehydratase, partial [Synechococcus sp.]